MLNIISRLFRKSLHARSAKLLSKFENTATELDAINQEIEATDHALEQRIDAMVAQRRALCECSNHNRRVASRIREFLS